MTPAQEAKLDAVTRSLERLSKQLGGLPSKPVALRMSRTAGGKRQGEVWIVGPYGCFHVTRPALDLLKITNQVTEHPTPVDPGYLESIPPLDPALAPAA